MYSILGFSHVYCKKSSVVFLLNFGCSLWPQPPSPTNFSLVLKLHSPGTHGADDWLVSFRLHAPGPIPPPGSLARVFLLLNKSATSFKILLKTLSSEEPFLKTRLHIFIIGLPHALGKMKFDQRLYGNRHLHSHNFSLLLNYLLKFPGLSLLDQSRQIFLRLTEFIHSKNIFCAAVGCQDWASCWWWNSKLSAFLEMTTSRGRRPQTNKQIDR